MIIVEYQVPMPFHLEEYRIGQLYTIAKKSLLEGIDSKCNSNGNSSVRINANEPYSIGPGGYGQYTNKTYYLANQIPDWMKKLLPESACKLKEEAWNAYPYSKNKFSNPLLERLTFEIESRYLQGPPTETNVFNLDRREEQLRSTVVIDFANENLKVKRKKTSSNKQCCTHDNDQVFTFEPLFREALKRDWLREFKMAYGDDNMQVCDGKSSENLKPLMTCYKLCRVNFPLWPIQNRVEEYIQNSCRDTIIESHRLTWLWQDEWTGMTMEDIRQMEKKTQDELFKLHPLSSDSLSY